MFLMQVERLRVYDILIFSRYEKHPEFFCSKNYGIKSTWRYSINTNPK